MSIQGLDISNYTGLIGPATTQCWYDNDIRHVVVRASLEHPDMIQLARRQMAACVDAGMTISAYIWVYFSEDPAATIAAALDAYADMPVKVWWLDAEETDPRWNGDSPEQRSAWLHTALDALNGSPCGLYTANWWWAPYMGGDPSFSSYPLWVAEYDGNPDLSVFYPFGGWTACQGKQYAGSGSLCGVGSLDLDTFDEALVAGTGGDVDAADRAELENLRNYIGGLTNDVLKPGLAAIEAAADGQSGKRWATVKAQVAAIREGSGVTKE